MRKTLLISSLVGSLLLLGAGCKREQTPFIPTEPNRTHATNTTNTTYPNVAATPTQPLQPTTAPIPKPATTKPKTTTPTTTKAPTTPTPSPIAKTIFTSTDLILTSVLSNYGADLNWTRSSVKDIRGYAVEKSTTNSSPSYPAVFWTTFINDIDVTKWTDRSLERGKKTYYRICTIGTDDVTFRCGNVVSILKP